MVLSYLRDSLGITGGNTNHILPHTKSLANWVNIDPRTAIGGKLITDLGFLAIDDRSKSDPDMSINLNPFDNGFYYQLMGGDISITISAS